MIGGIPQAPTSLFVVTHRFPQNPFVGPGPNDSWFVFRLLHFLESGWILAVLGTHRLRLRGITPDTELTLKPEIITRTTVQPFRRCAKIKAFIPYIHDLWLSSQFTTMESALGAETLPKIYPEAIPHPINRLPKDIFILIPRFFASEKGDRDTFIMNKPLITMTHVCRSWRSVLLSIPTLWTQIDFSTFESKQAEGFLARSGNQLLDVYQYVEAAHHVEPFILAILCNTHRLRWLGILCHSEHLRSTLAQLTKPVPELKHLKITNYFRVKGHPGLIGENVELPSTIFGGQFPKLATLSLLYLRTNLRDLNIPSLTRFVFTSRTDVSVQDLTSFFRRCPSLEFIEIHFSRMPVPSITPPRDRLCLAALKELRLGYEACISGLIDHLTLPTCTEVMLDEEFDEDGDPLTRIHPSSIDYLPVTRGIAKAAVRPNSYIFSGPNGNFRFRCREETRRCFDAEFFASFSPISISEIRELWIGDNATLPKASWFWSPATAEIRSAFGLLTKVEDLTIVSFRIEPFLSALAAAAADDWVPLPRLRRLTVFAGRWGLSVAILIQCAKTRKEHSRPLGEVTIVSEGLQVGVVEGVELLREFVGESMYRIGAAPKASWPGEDCELW